MADWRAWINEGAGRWTVIVVSVVLVVGAVGAAVMFGPWSSGSRRADTIRGRGVDVLYVCQGCKQTGKTRVEFGVVFPIVCPHCGEKKAVQGTVCVQCRKIMPAQHSSYYRCPYCRRVYDTRNPPAGARRPR